MTVRIAVLLYLLAAPVESEGQAPLADVPFVLHQNAIIITMVANDRDTVRLLLDTGWGPTALTDYAVARLRRAGRIQESNGWVTLASLSVGRVRKTAVRVELFPAHDLAPLIGPYDGVLATEYFKDLVLQVDYPRGRVRFFARSRVNTRAAANTFSLPMTFTSGASWLPFTDSIFINGRRAKGLIDTGGSGAFLAMPQLITALDLERSAQTLTGRMGYLDGSPRESSVRFARVRSIQVGGTVVDTPRVLLAPPQLAGGNWGHDVVIGYGFLRNYVVTFDYPGRRITLERHAPAPGLVR